MAFAQGTGPAPGAAGGGGSTYAPKMVAVPDTRDPVAARPLSDQDRSFIETAAARSAAAISMAQLAMTRSSNPEVRTLAEAQLREHTRMLDELKQLAERKEMTLSSDLTAEQKSSILGMHMLRGDEFDRAYTAAVRENQREAMDRLEEQRDKGSNILVRSYAAKNYMALKRLGEEEKLPKAE
ncbi:MAG TPA: DUF4142 domain-containing protein [Polyangia bacterium]|nr:DUF4142 domain-containing protein [Polyangia bacterium]